MKTLGLNLRTGLALGLVLLLVSLLLPQVAGARVPPGTDPNFPVELSLAPGQVSLKAGHLAAGEESWIAVEIAEIGGAQRQPLDLSLFVTPVDGNSIQNIRLDLLDGRFAEQWSRNQVDIAPFGQGRIIERDQPGDPRLGELVWSGHVNNGEAVFVCLINNNDFDVDYWLFTDEVLDAEFGQTPQPVVTAPYLEPGIDPNNTIAVSDGVTTAELAPGAERWYSLQASDLDEEMMENMNLSFYFTPNDGNILHQIHLDIFDGNQNQIWSRGDGNQMVNMGAGSIVHRDENPETGELFWSGWLVDNAVYTVCVRNDSSTPINYWLFTSDVTNPSLGDMSFY